MNKLINFIAILLVIYLSIPVKAQKASRTQRAFRTDGFYLFDNGIDTLRTIPDSKDLWVLYRQMLDKNGLSLDPKMVHCFPDSIGVLREGSTMLHYISFFSDTTGTAFEDGCRSFERVKHIADLIKTRKSNSNLDAISRIEKIHSIIYMNDSTILFTVSEEDYFKEKIVATIRNDSLFVNQTRLNMPNNPLAYAKRNYVFVPFSGIPANILPTAQNNNRSGK